MVCSAIIITIRSMCVVNMNGAFCDPAVPIITNNMVINDAII